MHFPPFATLVAFLLLFMALAAALFPRTRPASAALGMLSALTAAGDGLMTTSALLLTLPALALATARRHLPRGWPAGVALALCAAWALAAALHRLPGFTPWQWSESFGRGADLPLRWQLDKGLAGLVLLLALPPAPLGGARRWALVPLAALAIPLLALASGQARFAAFWGDGFALWLSGNLFLTVIAEEAFFRGLIQACLLRRAGDRLPFPVLLLVAALPFALVHLPWGPVFAVLALPAGLLYGAMAGRQGALLPAIATHFLCNASLLIFTRSPFG